ncbi:MAG TPA: polyprenyl synthetase family protein [Caulobacteraceae bacterium]|nr:polyprenyl synthetase family protein [Caulobacteraceae bacterium]
MSLAETLATATAGPTSSGLVGEVLEEYGQAARATVERYFDADNRSPYLHDLVVDYPRRGGKMMRSSLCIAQARAYGASLEKAVLTAAAIEMLHNGLLIHDDIQDASQERRGRPTLHAMHGVPLALNAGDMLMLLALRPLMDNVDEVGGWLAIEVLRETEIMARESAEGQALELGWRDLNDTTVTEADYLRMVLKKTAWFSTIYPARVGALIGSRGRVDPGVFMHFGFFLGAAFQIQDDLLNLVGDESYGKERNGDLYEGKRTLMLIHARGACSAADRAIFDALLAAPRERRTAEDVAWLRAAIERHGSIDYARKVAEALVGAAEFEYARLYADLPESRDKRFIAALIPWVLERS